MAGYISVTFEKDTLSNVGGVRVITRLIDQGDVPPAPSVIYFPTDPDALKYCIVGEVVAGGNEERFARIATLSELSSVNAETLNYFDDAAADFVSLGVTTSDILEIFHTYPEFWTSEEYPGERFQFSIVEVAPGAMNSRLRIGELFPSALPGLSWQIVRAGVPIISGSGGITKRSSLSTGLFRTHRFNSYFSDSVGADNFVAATKAQLQSLANETAITEFVDETFTIIPA